MKRRLNILCVIVVLVLSYSVFETGYYFIVGVKAGVEAGIDGNASEASQKKLMNMKYISLLPEHLSGLGDNGLFQDSVYNERSGEYVPVSFNSMMVSVDTESTTLEQAAFTLLNFLHIVICVWSIVLFVRLVISINKSDIFNWKNVHRLRLLGAALIISFCTALLPAYLTFRSVGNVFSVHAYKIVNLPEIEHPVSNAILATGGSCKERNLVIDPKEGVAGKVVTSKQTPLNDKGIRAMTPREWGKLQGFVNYAFIDKKTGEDKFSFPEKLADGPKYKQFGNAVTIPAVEEMAKFMKKCLKQLE